MEGKDILTSLVKVKTRDGAEIELKVYKSATAKSDAVLAMRCHGGGTMGFESAAEQRGGNAPADDLQVGLSSAI